MTTYLFEFNAILMCTLYSHVLIQIEYKVVQWNPSNPTNNATRFRRLIAFCVEDCVENHDSRLENPVFLYMWSFFTGVVAQRDSTV